MNPNSTRFLIFLIVIGFIELGSLITLLYFDRKQNKNIKRNFNEEKNEN